MKQLLFWYLLLINLVAFCLCACDKRAARQGRWRISERALIGCAVAFGAGGLYAGMRLFRHKTRKPRFAVGVPLLCLVQIAAIFAAYVLQSE